MLHGKLHSSIKTLFAQSDPELTNFDSDNERDSIVGQADIVLADDDATPAAKQAARIVKDCLDPS